jgi:hypothetical protein
MRVLVVVLLLVVVMIVMIVMMMMMMMMMTTMMMMMMTMMMTMTMMLYAGMLGLPQRVAPLGLQQLPPVSTAVTPYKANYSVVSLPVRNTGFAALHRHTRVFITSSKTVVHCAATSANGNAVSPRRTPRPPSTAGEPRGCRTCSIRLSECPTNGERWWTSPIPRLGR